MCAENVCHGVDLEEFLDDLCAKGVTSSSWTQRKLVAVGVRITPDQVGHRTFVWDFSEAVDDLDLIDTMDARRQTAVDAEDLVVDDAGEGEVVEHVGEVMPDGGVAVFATTFGIEAVGLSDSSGLVVAADEMNAMGIAKFETDQKRDGLYTKEAAINVVAYAWSERCGQAVACARHTEEEVVRVGTWPTDLEYLEEVKELAVDVADDGYWSLDVHDVALLHEHLFCLCAYCLDDRFGKQLLLVESGDAFVKIDAGLQKSALAAR